LNNRETAGLASNGKKTPQHLLRRFFVRSSATSIDLRWLCSLNTSG
jgi:hypothetical protein